MIKSFLNLREIDWFLDGVPTGVCEGVVSPCGVSECPPRCACGRGIKDICIFCDSTRCIDTMDQLEILTVWGRVNFIASHPVFLKRWVNCVKTCEVIEIPLKSVGRQFIPSDYSSQATVRPKWQFVLFGDNWSHLRKAAIRSKLFN